LSWWLGLIPIHVGLLGHVDHGKTALARALSEYVSTAGLDKHPQARERGMTIDLGFTFFRLNDFLVTLVDAPGHADLVRNVVAGVNIIDAAILVIAADEGPKVQTGEHVLILHTFGVSSVVVALSKIDLVGEEQARMVEGAVRRVLKGTILEGAPVVRVSAFTGEGLDELKRRLLEVLKAPRRNIDGPFMMPIDHAFHVRGAGTVVTGTVHRGVVRVGDTVEVMPLGLKVKVRSIQSVGEERGEARAGDRVGVAVAGVEPEKIYRGCYLGAPGALRATSSIMAKVKFNSLFKYSLRSGSDVHLTVGMPTVTAKIYPLRRAGEEGVYVPVREVRGGGEILCYFVLSHPVVAEEEMPVLVSKLDLPPTVLRIAGGGRVTDANPGKVRLASEKVKVGVVRMKRGDGWVVSGLSSSRVGAERLVGETVEGAGGVKGRVVEAFGGRGDVVAEFDGEVREGEEVYLRVLRFKGGILP
ncbi:MAG: selenocysteine-specific translation elongation factor, partial [Candidatus Jordarchaeales archaeon]